MSFDLNLKKPKLVEGKLVKFFNEKYKLQQEKILHEQIQTLNSQPWYKLIGSYSWSFIKENYGFFILIFLILILLYVRYIEVNNRKEKMKGIINQINIQENQNYYND